MNKILLYICVGLFSSLTYSQVVLESSPAGQLGANYFLGGQFYSGAQVNVGKGLYFPRTDLTQFSLDIDKLYGVNGDIETGYDGMVVYNTATGTTGTDVDTQGIQVPVEQGFYYFSNPTADDLSSDVSTGQWVKLGGAGGNFWALDGNGGTTEVTLADVANADYTITAGNFVGTTDDINDGVKNLTLGTNNIARLEVGESNSTVGGTDFDFVLDVYGKARFRDGLVTSNSTYPDYVFDNYFTGASAVNPNYAFKNLNEVEAFIKENNHLPGVTSIDDLNQVNGAYEVDNAQLAIQTLEKVEELYLHVIEQAKEIEALKAEINNLKK